MESAAIFLDHGMYEQCQSVAGMAVRAMLKAYYLKVNGILPESSLTPDFWISNVHLITDVNIDLDWISDLFRLQEYPSLMETTYQPSEEQTWCMFRQLDGFLYQLSPSVVEDNSRLYKSVL